MREKLSRGKRIDNGEWVVGIPWIFSPPVNKAVIVYAMGLVGEDDDTSRYCECHEVDPSTIGQYTGLTDKNGKKIFEGDILEHTNVNGETYKEYVVDGQWSYKWAHGVYGFSLTDLNGGRMMDLRYTKSYEVIGNIHDNPELLPELLEVN